MMALRSLVLLLAAAGAGPARTALCAPSLSSEVTGAGVTVRWTVPAGEEAGISAFLLVVEGPGALQSQESLPASDRERFLPMWLEQGEEAEARLFVRTGSGGFAQGGSIQIKGPFSETGLSASGSVAGASGTSCVVKAVVEGGTAEVRVYSGPALLARMPAGTEEARVEGLVPGTRYELALIPFTSAEGKELRGRRTLLPPFTTSLERGFAVANGGMRISGDEDVRIEYFNPGQAMQDKDGNLLFSIPHSVLGACAGRFNAKARKWEILGLSGWTEDKSRPARPLFDGLFQLKFMQGFEDPQGNLHAICDCYTSAGKEILDIHGSIHHFRWTGTEWEQYSGGTAFSRYDSRPLFNTWTGSGAGWGFAMNAKNQVGIAVHVNKSLSLNGRIIAARIDFSDKKGLWSAWTEGKWQPHSYSCAYLPDAAPPADRDDTDPRIVCLDGKSMWLAIYRRGRAGGGKPFWTAMLYDDSKSKWLRWTDKGFAEAGDSARFFEQDLDAPTVGLFREDGGGIALIGQSGNDLLRMEYKPKTCKWEAAEKIGRVAGQGRYSQEYRTCISPSGRLVVAWSEDGNSVSLLGVGKVAVSTSRVKVCGVGHIGKNAVVVYSDGPELKAATERPIQGEKVSAAPPLPAVAEAEPDPAVLKYEGSFINFAQDPVVPEGAKRPVTPSYGPQNPGHMAATPDGMVFAPRFAVCNICIFPPDHPGKPGVFWGGFWDYFMFPMGVAVDHKRGKVFISHRVTSGGCGGILGGSVEVWDLSQASVCHWLKPGLEGAARTEQYKPGRIQDVFRWPCGMAVDAERGLLYVANSLACDVRKYDVAGSEAKRVGVIGDGALDFPYGVACSSAGDVYVVDSRKHRICVFDRAGKLVRSFGGPGREQGLFLYPWGIAVDPKSGAVFVSDPQNSRVQAFDREGKLLSCWNRFKAANLDGTPVEAGGARIAGMRGGPPGDHDETYGLCCDGRGYLYVGTGPYIARFRILAGK